MTQVHRAACHPCGHASRICSALCFACSCACPLHPVPRHTPPSLSYWELEALYCILQTGKLGQGVGVGTEVRLPQGSVSVPVSLKAPGALVLSAWLAPHPCACSSSKCQLPSGTTGWGALVALPSCQTQLCLRAGERLKSRSQGDVTGRGTASRALQGAQGRSTLRRVPWGLVSVWLHQSPRGCWLLRDTHCVPMRCHSPGDTLGSAHSY